MAFVVAKQIGDGLSTATAFHLVIQKKGVPILTPDWCPTDEQGQWLLPYAIVEIPDEHAPLLSKEVDCYVISDVTDKQVLSAKLAEQNCFVDVSQVVSAQDLTQVFASELQVTKII